MLIICSQCCCAPY